MPDALWIAIAVAAVLVVIVALIVGLVRYRRRQISLTARQQTGTLDRSGGYTTSSGITFSQSTAVAEPTDRVDTTGLPGVGDDAAVPRDAVRRPISDVALPETETLEPPDLKPAAPPAPAAPGAPPAPAAPPAPDIGTIAPPEGRLERLRGRLAKSQNTLGRSMLGLLGAGDLDEDSWQDVEDTLLIADLGPVATASVVLHLRSQLASSTVRTEA
ncbi:MAG TPA: signal recognition particle receptor subunit alpha, partial [Mycobacterium sp.]|nr:signal recognition particle receptor subunit alpha [Mycobacterium sp.]